MVKSSWYDEPGSEREAVAVDDVDEREVSAQHAASLTYFGTDFDVHGLVRRLENDDITIPTFDPNQPTDSGIEGFQRRFVWRKPQMDRFIESLLLGYPVPGIFLVQQPNKRMLVLDGQQRLRTLRAFYNNQYRENPYKLEGVDEALKDKTYGLLDGDARRTLDNTFIHATIVRNEPSPDGYRAVYQLFERLNTGGTNLQPQEIRVALFHGRFVGLLRELNDDKNWRHLYGKRSERLKDQELILRFFALFHTRKNYERPLKFFLNSYMEANQDSPESECDSNLRLFELTSESIRSGIGLRAFRIRRNLNAALCDAIMVGVADRLSRGPIADLPGLSKAYDVLLQDAEFLASITSATANEESVSLRLSRASKAFARVK